MLKIKKVIDFVLGGYCDFIDDLFNHISDNDIVVVRKLGEENN